MFSVKAGPEGSSWWRRVETSTDVSEAKITSRTGDNVARHVLIMPGDDRHGSAAHINVIAQRPVKVPIEDSVR
jgi:hypothetical protein